MAYTIATLREINQRYCGSHTMVLSDVDMANSYVELIESTRSTEMPKVGDILQLTNKHGEYFAKAHIEREDMHYGGNICEHPSVPFIHANEDNTGIRCNTSGGAWCSVDFRDMKYVGKTKKRFCDWGWCGACADGAVEFEAEVSVWEYTDPEQLFPGFTTREYEKYYISDSGEDSDYTSKTGYRYHISRGGYMNCKAFKDKAGLDAWLKTFKGTVFDGFWENQKIVWTYKQFEQHVSPLVFDKLPVEEDTMIFNGAVRRCKRFVNDEQHWVTTYFVWYWDEPEREGETYSERYMRQNKIRDEKYTLPWNTPEYALAKGISIKGGN